MLKILFIFFCNNLNKRVNEQTLYQVGGHTINGTFLQLNKVDEFTIEAGVKTTK